jgi:phage repressor protein C with HTH and peptisase S24 domain
LLGGPPPAAPAESGLVSVARLDVGASAGPGALGADESALGAMAFDAQWLRRLGIASRESLSLIRVQGDSMAPTLTDGDEILVDGSDAAERLRDGIYVLRIDDALVVKRLAVSPGRRVAVRSDNEAYPGWPDCDLASIDIVGRVIWAGRRIR